MTEEGGSPAPKAGRLTATGPKRRRHRALVVRNSLLKGMEVSI